MSLILPKKILKKIALKKARSMYKLCIVGLGNPDKKYNNTRHNIGKDWLIKLSEVYNITFTTKTKFEAEIGESHNGSILWIIPTNYVNNSGRTLSKIMDASEGCHKPLGKYILNNINFQASDPLVEKLRAANYNVFENPYDKTGVIASFPIKWDDIEFDEKDGKLVNLESAVTQLDRYKFLMDNWTDHNTSITVSYSPDEIPSIIDWILEDKNWNSYVGVSFLLRADPTKTAKDLGYPYLPQQVITQEEYDCYNSKLKSFDLDEDGLMIEDLDADCATGACPVR